MSNSGSWKSKFSSFIAHSPNLTIRLLFCHSPFALKLFTNLFLALKCWLCIFPWGRWDYILRRSSLPHVEEMGEPDRGVKVALVGHKSRLTPDKRWSLWLMAGLSSLDWPSLTRLVRMWLGHQCIQVNHGIATHTRCPTCSIICRVVAIAFDLNGLTIWVAPWKLFIMPNDACIQNLMHTFLVEMAACWECWTPSDPVKSWQCSTTWTGELTLPLASLD